MALDELQNQARPARRAGKVYGRRKGMVAESRGMHRDLFGNDENEIERRLEGLKLAPTDSQRCPQEDTRACRIEESKGLTLRATKHTSRKKPPAKRKPPTQNSTRVRKRRTITPDEARELEPLLLLTGNNTRVIDFEYLGEQIHGRHTITKVGDGSFGECFSLGNREISQPHVAAVLKIIPFGLESEQGHEMLSGIDDVVREAKLHRALGSIHGFAQLRSVHVVRGKFHDEFLEAFRRFQLARDDEIERDDPATLYPEDQFFLVIEMEYAGEDLESLTNPSVFQVFDAFWTTAIILAKAEEQLQFEHRDLHLSNICFTASGDESASFAAALTEPEPTILGLSGLRISIIDYTMSRARLDDGECEVIYGKLEECSQPLSVRPSDSKFDIERHQQLTGWKVQEWARQQEKLESANGNRYQRFLPKSNVIWLSHALMGLMMAVDRAGGRRVVNENCEIARTLQAKLWNDLDDVLKLVNAEELDSLPESSQDLLAGAIEKGWLKQEDVEAFGERLGED